MKFDTTDLADDIALAIANVLIALHRTKQLDLATLTPVLAQVNAETWFQPKYQPDRAHSATGQRLLGLLTTQLQWGEQTPPAAP